MSHKYKTLSPDLKITNFLSFSISLMLQFVSRAIFSQEFRLISQAGSDKLFFCKIS
jgi:hypothetical protein